MGSCRWLCGRMHRLQLKGLLGQWRNRGCYRGLLWIAGALTPDFQDGQGNSDLLTMITALLAQAAEG